MKNLLTLVLFVSFLSGIPAVSAQTRNKANGSGSSSAASAARFGNVDSISARQLREHLEFIASDELEGRDTPSRGLNIAAMYIAKHLANFGIQPAGDEGSYFQRFPLKSSKIVPKNTRFELNGQAYEYGNDFLSTLFPAEIANAGLVFAGNGWVVKSKNINPYQGIDVKDKIVVVVNSLPKGVTFGDLKGPAGGDWMSPSYYAQMNGAKAVITFPSFGNMANWDASKWTQSEKGTVEFGDQKPLVTIPSITLSPRVLTAVFQGEKLSAGNIFTKAVSGEPLESFDLKPAKRVNASIVVRSETVYTQNVVGVLEGSDPVLKNEYVAIGAHYDHVGINPNAPGPDKIWNGADDDGSGTVAVLSIAEALAKSKVRPKRSILFVWHCGEEKGLWGSEYFNKFPTVDIKKVIAQLNIDMIGRSKKDGDTNPKNKELSGPNEIYVIGKDMMSSTLGSIVDGTNKDYLKLAYDTRYDDPKDPNRFFFRSDHFNYAQNGIPITFWFDGVHEDYHQPGDEPDKIDYDKMEKVARTIFLTLWEVSDLAARPVIDKQLPAELTQR